MSDFELLLDEDNELRFNVAVEGSGTGSIKSRFLINKTDTSISLSYKRPIQPTRKQSTFANLPGYNKNPLFAKSLYSFSKIKFLSSGYKYVIITQPCIFS